jgi:hypothetical protein
MTERREDKGREMRNLITPARIVTVVITILFMTVTYLAGRTWDKASVDLSTVQASVVKIEREKLDITRYEQECEINRLQHDAKAEKEDMKRIDRRLTMILDVMIDPTKREQFKAEHKAMEGRN